MTAPAIVTGEKTKQGFLNRLSLQTKIIGIAVLVVLVLVAISIPNDRSQLLIRQERVEAAQVAYELALPAINPMLEGVIASIDNTGEDLSGSRFYTGLANTLTTFGRENASAASRFQSLVTFSRNVHSLLEGTNAVPALDTTDFRTVVANMDTTLSVAWLALTELNVAVDEYNGYHSWISAAIAGTLFGLPQGYPDPIPTNSRLNQESLAQ